uniref:Androglobin n=1 Tax=Timema douglasi TaxID=61478 RepID=A0A7R8VHZ8_TIMDO|nr:unnamed protein product [Timema douglasi]
MSKYFDLNRPSLKKKDLSSPQASDANISWSFLVEHLQPPWPEWNDADLNLERWDIIKDKLRQGLAKASSMDSKTSSYFEDPQHAAVPLPTSLKVASWKRPSEVFSDEVLTLYENRTEVIDLVTRNGHLMQSELMRWVISGISAVRFIALTDPFPVEGESLTFIPTTGSDPWQPWHLVYSLCKAGKGHVHKPVMNQSGKYVVRLYYLGCWRKLVVDDRVPVDLEGNILLPITTKNELWPIVLCKALLKLACLTWTGNREVVEFSVISCLTGWVQCEESLRKMSKDEVWRFCCSNVSCYKPEEDSYERISMKNNRGGNIVALKNNQQRHVSSNKSNGQKSSLSKGSSPINSKESHKGVSQVVLFGATDKLGTFVTDLGPFWSHPFFIYQTRDVPLKGHTPKPPIQLWKRIRWLDWAKRKGLIHSTEPVPELKCLKIVSCFKKWREIVGQEESSNHFNEYVHGNRESIMRQSSYTKKGSELKKSRNDGFYIFIDSTEKIQMVISLTILPKLAIQMKNLKHKSIITSYSNEEFEMQRSRKPMLSACITVEKYSWNDFKINEPIYFIKTFGMKSIMVDMEEGRNVLRVWVRSESAYVAHFMSNFPLFVCHREHLWNVLQRDCEKIHRFGTEVSAKFLALIQQFGRDEYAKARSEFYQVINTLTITPTSRPRLHVAFFNEMLKVIKTYITSNDELKQCINALRVMLLRLDLYLVSRKFQDYGTVINTEELMFDSFSASLEKEQAERASALFIQALFSRNLLNKMKALHNPNNKSHKTIVEKLRKINEVVFNVNRRDTTVSMMVWSVFTENPSLVEVCSFKYDLDLVLNVTEWKASTTNALPNTWVPLIHATLQCHAKSPTLCVVEVNCPLQVYMVRIFDNDSMKEMSRITHSVIPNYYCQNERGYTLLVYGWMEDIRSKEVSWRMQIITNKGNLSLHFCSKAKSTMTCTLTKAPDMGVQEIKDIYIPNRKNLVFRCLLKIKQRALLSFRITPSYNQAKLMVSLKTVDDKLLAQESSESCVVIPAVFVEMNDQLEETTFVLEAIILDDSWPVKHTEFPTVKKIKLKGQQKQNLSEVRGTTRSVIIPKPSRKTLDTSSTRPHDRRASKSRESTETTQDKPFWHLQVFHGDEHDHIKLSQDNNQKYIFQELKKSWELNDPGRAARGTKLRRRFLIKNYLQKTSSGKTFHSTETLEAGVSTAIIDADDMNLSSNRLQSSSYSSNVLVGQDSERRVKTARDHEEDLRNLQKKKEEFEFLHARLRRGIEDFSTAQRERHAKAIRLLNESRQESARIMSSAYSIRDRIVSERMEELLPQQEEKYNNKKMSLREEKRETRGPQSEPVDRRGRASVPGSGPACPVSGPACPVCRLACLGVASVINEWASVSSVGSSLSSVWASVSSDQQSTPISLKELAGRKGSGHVSPT